MNNLKTNIDDLDVGKLKTVPGDSQKLSDVVDNEVVKNTKCNTLKTKLNTLEKKKFLIQLNSHKSIQHR